MQTQKIDFTANIESPHAAPRKSRLLTRGRLIGLAGALVMVSLYFGTVVWIGNGLAADVKAGTREVPVGQLVADQAS